MELDMILWSIKLEIVCHFYNSNVRHHRHKVNIFFFYGYFHNFANIYF